ncbi:MAG: CU044_2847 family protein [Mastigocoleus sp. MO_167.B18]|nr:CU044_2847 family protein [Mastigocoleus sp. MO_167.B18]
MSQIQRMEIQEDGETYEIYIETKEKPDSSKNPTRGGGMRPGEKGIDDKVILKMREARQTIRGYAVYALGAFKDFKFADVEEVTLKFGMKIGGKAGIPYITEGTAESNLEIEVKCKFPSHSQNQTGS